MNQKNTNKENPWRLLLYYFSSGWQPLRLRRSPFAPQILGACCYWPLCLMFCDCTAVIWSWHNFFPYFIFAYFVGFLQLNKHVSFLTKRGTDRINFELFIWYLLWTFAVTEDFTCPFCLVKCASFKVTQILITVLLFPHFWWNWMIMCPL